MGTVIQDLRFAARTLLRRPGFTAVVLLTLAVGIGSTTAIYSVVDGVLLRPLPFPEAERIHQLWEGTPSGGRGWVSAPNFRDWRERLDSYSGIAAFTPEGFNVAGGGSPERIDAMAVTPGYFEVLGVSMALGRGFTPEEGTSPAAPVAVISDGLWRRQLGASPDALGRTLELGGAPHRIVGVLPPGMAHPAGRDVWVPVDLESAEWRRQRGTSWLMVVGRLAPGVEPEAARDEREAVGRALAEDYPDANGETTIAAVPLMEEIVGDVRGPLLILLGAVALVLLVVCVNVSGLMLARGTRRRREMAIRRSLGGSRGRLLRQLLTESLLVSLLGGALGVALAWVGLDVLLSVAPTDVPRLDRVALDGRVLGVGLLVTLASGLVAGLVPALRESRADPREGLVATAGSGEPDRFDSRTGLVVVQVALAVILVVGAGHLVESFRNLRAVDPGLEPAGVLTARVPLTEARYPGDEEVAGFYTRLLDRTAALPGVTSAGVVSVLPLGGNNVIFSFELRDPPPGLDEDDLVAGYQSASAGYFDAVGIPLLDGRGFRPGEGPDDEPVVIVDRSFADRFFPEGDAVGREILAVGDEWRRVVGVVGPVRRSGLRRPPEPQFYVPLRQDPRDAMTLVLKAGTGEPLSLLPQLRDALREIDPAQPLVEPRTLTSYLERGLAGSRFSLSVVSFFGAVALFLAALGIYGMVSHAVGSRIREIGIRMALGAGESQVRGTVVRRAVGVAAVGLVLGAAGAVPLLRVARGTLFGVAGMEPVIVGAVAVVLLAVSLAAAYLPARRATRVDPVQALRWE